MANYTSVLEKAEQNPVTVDRVSAVAPAPASGRRAFAELQIRLFAAASHRVVAFAAVSSGAGATRTVRDLAAEIVRSGKTVAVFDGELNSIAAGAAPHRPILGAPQTSAAAAAFTTLTAARENHDCVLIDCGSLDKSADLMRVGPMADGVVLVLEAGRTSRDQLDRAVQLVHELKATLLGSVLNKRRYPVPAWLYRLL